jgi:LPS-assembly lipoprotein
MNARCAPVALLVTVIAQLAGCGFHLEGSEALPTSLAVVQIDASHTQSDFYFGLRRALMQAGSRIDDDDGHDGHDGHDSTEAVIHILDDAATQRTLTVSTSNVPTEYELTYRLKFSVSIQGKEVIAPEQHALVRDYSYSESAQLAKDRESAILSQALAHDLVSVVMRRLASLPASPPHS